MHLDAIKESFDQHDRPTVNMGAVEIEENLRLAKTGRKLVFRFAGSRNPSGIGHQNSGLVMNRNNNSTLHTAFSRVETDAEEGGAVHVHTALGEIGMALVNTPKSKGQWLVALF